MFAWDTFAFFIYIGHAVIQALLTLRGISSPIWIKTFILKLWRETLTYVHMLERQVSLLTKVNTRKAGLSSALTLTIAHACISLGEWRVGKIFVC